jgi:hypothetical protein
MNVGIGYLHVGILNAVVRDRSNCISVLAARADFQNYIELRSISQRASKSLVVAAFYDAQRPPGGMPSGLQRKAPLQAGLSSLGEYQV